MAIEVRYKIQERPIEEVLITGNAYTPLSLRKTETDNVILKRGLHEALTLGRSELSDAIRALQILEDGHE